MVENRRISMNLRKEHEGGLRIKNTEKEYKMKLTLREAYDLFTMKKILKEHEMPVYDYLYELPRKFSVVYSANPKQMRF